MREYEEKVIIAALGFYRLRGCPLANGVTRDELYREWGVPLRRETPPEMRTRWRGMVRQVHESMLGRARGN